MQGANGPISPLPAHSDNGQLAAILAVSVLVSAVGSYRFFRWVAHQAPERGMIDRTSEH